MLRLCVVSSVKHCRRLDLKHESRDLNIDPFPVSFLDLHAGPLPLTCVAVSAKLLKYMLRGLRIGEVSTTQLSAIQQ